MRNNVRRNNKKKNKKKSKIILIITILLIIIALGIFTYELRNQNQQVEETEQTEPTKIEELQEKEEIRYSMTNGGDFVKMENYIAYLHKLDKNYLYIFNIENNDGIEVNTPKSLEKIYFDGENIYGIPSHYNGKGIYKIDLQGNVTQIYEGESLQLWLTGDKIYFVKQEGFDQINQIPQGDLCSMDKNGENITTIIPDTRSYFKIQNDKIYYSNTQTKGLYEADLNGENKKELAQGRISIAGINKDYIIYLDYADEESYYVLYLDDMTNHKIGRFGNCYVKENEGYLFTRKLIDKSNNIENEFCIFKIDKDKKEEKELYKYKMGLPYLSYVYKNKAYIKTQEVERINLEDGNIEKNIPNGYYLDGYCYQIKASDDKSIQISIYNLETLEQEKTVDLEYKSNNPKTNEDTQTEVNTSNNVSKIHKK